MLQRLKISIIALSVAILIVATVLPHHHHESSICFMIERCGIDGKVNDVHTMHHNEYDGNENSGCSFTSTPAVTSTPFSTSPHVKPLSQVTAMILIPKATSFFIRTISNCFLRGTGNLPHPPTCLRAPPLSL